MSKPKAASSSSSSAAHAKSKKEPGDKVFVGGSEDDRAVLIADMIDCIQQKGPKTLLITLADLSAFLSLQPPLSPSNLYRKQYGNLEHVFATEHIFASLFVIEKSVVKLQNMGVLKIALDKKLLSQELYFKCMNMHTVKKEHDLKALKSVNKNQCKVCGVIYPVAVNVTKLCGSAPGGPADHDPRYDFTLDDDVLKCELRLTHF